jgi:biopolymer transport protein ExbB
MWLELAKTIQSGDVYMHIMSAISFLGLMVFFERFFTLYFSYNVNARKFISELRKMVLAEDFVRAESLCKSSGKSALPLIGLRAVETAQTDPSRVRGVIEEESIDFIPKIEARVSLLPALASLTLLVGILATIHHVWIAFHAMEALDSAQRQLTLADGLARSLNYTCYGLIIGALFVILHYFVKSLAIKITDRLNYGVTALTNLLAPATMAYAASPMAMPVAPAAAPVQEETTQKAEAQEDTSANDSSESEDTIAKEDASDEPDMDDIKDEEEII